MSREAPARRFAKPEGLRQRRQFLRVQGEGRRFRREHVLLVVAAGEAPGPRVGYTVSRKVGNAVNRNRVRRRLREIVRLHRDLLLPGTDHVLIAFDNAAAASYATLDEETTWLLTTARERGRPRSGSTPSAGPTSVSPGSGPTPSGARRVGARPSGKPSRTSRGGSSSSE